MRRSWPDSDGQLSKVECERLRSHSTYCYSANLDRAKGVEAAGDVVAVGLEMVGNLAHLSGGQLRGLRALSVVGAEEIDAGLIVEANGVGGHDRGGDVGAFFGGVKAVLSEVAEEGNEVVHIVFTDELLARTLALGEGTLKVHVAGAVIAEIGGGLLEKLDGREDGVLGGGNEGSELSHDVCDSRLFVATHCERGA